MPFALPPGPRLAYDEDGTVALHMATLTEFTASELAAMNSFAGVSISGAAGDTVLVFPVPMRLRGIFVQVNYTAYQNLSGTSHLVASSAFTISTSIDSSNGVDGAWSAPQSVAQDSPEVSIRDAFRALNAESGHGIVALTGSLYSNIRAIRITPPASGTLVLHLYGLPDTVAGGTDYVQFWSAARSNPLSGSELTFGDVALGSSNDKSFRLKNGSALHTAKGIVITTDEVPGDGTPSPSVVGQFVFSGDGGQSWFPSVTIGALGPGSVSGAIQIRRTTPFDSETGTWSPRVLATVGSWSS